MTIFLLEVLTFIKKNYFSWWSFSWRTHLNKTQPPALFFPEIHFIFILLHCLTFRVKRERATWELNKVTSLTTDFHKRENFASFRSKICQRKGLRERARTSFMSFTAFGRGWSSPQTHGGRTFLLFFHPSLVLFLFFFLFWSQISRIKYGPHMLLLTIGIHHDTWPNATQTGGHRGTERVLERWESRL